MVEKLEVIMICLQKRYNILREISRLTEELVNALERRDSVSSALILEMRGEQMERDAACQEELLQIAENVPEFRKTLYEAAFGPIPDLTVRSETCRNEKEAWIWKKIFDIRSHSQKLIEEIRSRDNRITRKVRQKT